MELELALISSNHLEVSWIHHKGNFYQWHIQSFFGQTNTYIKPTKVPPWSASLSKFSKFVLPDALKSFSLALSVLRLLRKIFSKLFKFVVWNTLLHGWFLKKPYIQLKNLYGCKHVQTVKLSELKRRRKKYRSNHIS